ncbi:MAG: PepSY domain-containing protein [Pseudomonadota bacterium]
MKRIRSFLAGILAALSLGLIMAVPANAGGFAQDQSRSDQGEARKEMRAGNQLSLREIERRVLPRMKGSEYLGPAYDSTARAYRLKFIKDGRVTYVDVDARTGRIINRSS